MDTRCMDSPEHLNTGTDNLPLLRVTASGVKVAPQPKSMYFTCQYVERSADTSITMLFALMSR